MKILIAIPCYNCEKQVLRVLESFESTLVERMDIVLIDNGSRDKTVDVIKKFCSQKTKHRILLYQNSKNYGLGGTHKVAFDLSIKKCFDATIVFHGDDQAQVGDIYPLLNAYKNNKCSILGSRFSKGSSLINYQSSRIVGNKVLNIVFSIFLKKKIYDLGSGLNLFCNKSLQSISYHSLTDSFNFNVEMLLLFIKEKKCFEFMPITWTESDQISNAKNLNVALSMLKSLFLWFFSFGRNKPSKTSKDYRSKLICSNYY